MKSLIQLNGVNFLKNPTQVDSNTAQENKISKLQAVTQENKIPENKISKLHAAKEGK